MNESPDRLLERIRLGEDTHLEFKEVMIAGDRVRGPSREDLADELAAMANAHGGTFVLGVHDRTKEVVGIPPERLDTVERFVHEVCNDSIKPPLMPRIERLNLPGSDGKERPILRVDLTRSLFVHKSPGGYWYRVGSSKREMTTEYLARMMQQRSQSRLIRFDEQVVAGCTVADMDGTAIDRFRTPRSGDDRDNLLRKLAMTAEDEAGAVRPTVAGVLLGTSDPRRWLPHAYIQAVAYRGDATPGAEVAHGYQMDAQDIGGPLDQQVADACRFVLRNMRVEASKTMGRSDTPQYDMTAVFEALVNAVAHRDYSMYGSRIRLRMFATRLDLYSPGPLVNTMSVETLPYRQASRNEAVTSLLAKCRVPEGIAGLDTTRTTLMDRRGEGVSAILERSERLSGARPTYSTPDDSELLLTIHAASALGAGEPIDKGT